MRHYGTYGTLDTQDREILMVGNGTFMGQMGHASLMLQWVTKGPIGPIVAKSQRQAETPQPQSTETNDD
jgi:hypothetical protein